MPDEEFNAGAHGPFEGDPGRSRRRAALRAVLPWVVGGLLVLVIAAGAGLGTAYLIATFRAAPPPRSALVTPPPIPTPTPMASPSPSEAPSPSPSATPSPTVEPSPAPEATPLVHIVARGESISLIAVQYGTTVEEIVALNQLQNPNLIVPGQQLLIPPPAPEP